MSRGPSTAVVLCGLLLGTVLLNGFESGAADVYLKATRPDFEKIPIGVLGFPAEAEARWSGMRVAEILKADLRRSQIFSVLDLGKMGIKVRTVDRSDRAFFQQLIDHGVSVLVWGSIGAQSEDLQLDAYVYDGGTDEVVVGKRYVGLPSVAREMAHRLADELVFRYTGEPGIARTKIAYVGGREGARELYVMDYDGHDPRQVTADGFLNLMPQWSPDRRYLVFTSYRSRSRQKLMLIELATGKRWTVVALDGLNITPAFSPDGTHLAFSSSRDGNAEIYKLDTRAKKLDRLTAHPAGDLSPTWSPSGRELAFTSDRGGGPQIYLMGADGSNVRRLTFDGDYNAAPVWSPRGNWIAHVCRTEQRAYKICVTSPDGGERRQVTRGEGVDDSPSWSPDGRHLVFSSMLNGRSHIYMVNTDGSDLERLTVGSGHYSAPAWSPT